MCGQIEHQIFSNLIARGNITIFKLLFQSIIKFVYNYCNLPQLKAWDLQLKISDFVFLQFKWSSVSNIVAFIELEENAVSLNNAVGKRSHKCANGIFHAILTINCSVDQKQKVSEWEETVDW